MLGLFAFFYATVHLTSYFAFDRFFAFGEILGDIAKRPFITAGLAAFVLMVPLAVTSTKGWIRRLGRSWQAAAPAGLRRAIAACLHFIWKVKVVIGEPVYYAAILALLLGFRLVWQLRASRRCAPPTCTRVTVYPDSSNSAVRSSGCRICPFTPGLCQLA